MKKLVAFIVVVAMVVSQNCTKDMINHPDVNDNIYTALKKSYDERFFSYNYLSSSNLALQEINEVKKVEKGVPSNLDLKSLSIDDLYSPFLQKVRAYYKNNPTKRYYVQNKLGFPLWDYATEHSWNENNLVIIPVASQTSLFTEAIIIIFKSKEENKLRFHYVKREQLDTYPILNSYNTNGKIPDKGYFLGLFLFFDKIVFNYSDCDLVKKLLVAESRIKDNPKGITNAYCYIITVPYLDCHTWWVGSLENPYQYYHEICHEDYYLSSICISNPPGDSTPPPPGGGSTPPPPDNPPVVGRTAVPCAGDPISAPTIAPACVGCPLSTGRWGAPRNNHPHTGVDIGGIVGENLRPMYPGIVLYTHPVDDGNAGKYVEILCYIASVDAYIKFTFMHLNEIFVTDGQNVNTGTIFATLGSTGNAINVAYKHIHIETRYQYYNGLFSDPFDPEQYLSTKYTADGTPIPCGVLEE